jgi:phage-related protein
MTEGLNDGLKNETIQVVPAVIHPRARECLRALPPAIQKAMGKAILELQRGAVLRMPVSRPMPSVGPGVHELRIKDESGAYRSLYAVKFRQAVYILHVFEKRSRATSQRDIELGRKRLKELLP